MKYEVSYDKERDLIVGRVEGDLNSALVKEMSSAVAEVVRKTGCCNILNDLRDARIASSAFDVYKMPGIINNQGVPNICKRALIVSEESKGFRFLETVSVNVGQQVRIFTDPESAIEWLSGSPEMRHA